jgi:hypothetical protein
MCNFSLWVENSNSTTQIFFFGKFDKKIYFMTFDPTQIKLLTTEIDGTILH